MVLEPALLSWWVIRLVWFRSFVQLCGLSESFGSAVGAVFVLLLDRVEVMCATDVADLLGECWLVWCRGFWCFSWCCCCCYLWEFWFLFLLVIGL
ncbi:hypothetical protein MtrunA17_Chr6g0483741 [Medicago truncatula]|uniref:Transmembrane protein n=1 Tax=Medicago truncatula TaxID=3880 RepID=A0A396HJE9_MEDTR|nr:hypothetical protein MtrunA17_Chr6g0483741 [Medicago truncatula]